MDLSFLLGQKASVVLKKNILTINYGQNVVSFIAKDDNYNFQFDTGLLGRDYCYDNKSIIIKNQAEGAFINGNEYVILSVEYYNDVQGETTVRYKKCFSSLYVELQTCNEKYCDITLESDNIEIKVI